MKIGEFFVDLFFKVDGDDAAKEVDNKLNKIALSSGKVALALGAVTAAMAAMFALSKNAAVGFSNFAKETGLSTQGLQKWQYLADANNVKGEELTATIKGILDAKEEIRLGGGNFQAWALLGIDPRDDPYKTLDKLRDKLKTFQDVGLARKLANQVGVSDNVFRLLRQPTLNYDPRLSMTDAEIERMDSLNNSWLRLIESISRARNRLFAQFGEPLKLLLDGFYKLTTIFISFVEWLGKGSIVATYVKINLFALAAAVVALAAAFSALSTAAFIIPVVTKGIATLTALSGPLGIFMIAVKGIGAALLALGIGLAPFLGVLALIGGVLAAIILLVQDFWVKVHGGEAVGSWTYAIAGVNALAGAIEGVISVYDKLIGRFDKSKEHFDSMADDFKAAGDSLPDWLKFLFTTPEGLKIDPSRLAPGATVGSNSTTNHLKVEVNVEGGGDPHQTGVIVAKSIRSELLNAGYQFAPELA